MKLFLVLSLSLIMSIQCSPKKTGGQLLTNHIGYQVNGIKKVIFQGSLSPESTDFHVLDMNDEIVYSGEFSKTEQIEQWHTGQAAMGDFTAFIKEGEYYIGAQVHGTELKSHPFTIGNQLLAESCLPLLMEGFEQVRCTGEYDEKDKNMTFFGERKDTVDVHGGWYDASGERGKYLSHLCFSNFLVPQQTPMFVWGMMESLKNYDGTNRVFMKKLESEIAFGADFLVRMQDDAGYFYLTVFANWSWEINQREISAYFGQEGKKNDQYQAGFREGGGMAIAALARASMQVTNGEFVPSDYLNAAKKGFFHLNEFNHLYIDDGKENIIDDYCALIAAVELFDATGDNQFLEYAKGRAESLTNRLASDGTYTNWWRADDQGERPFFHGAEAGLPIISLCKYLTIENDSLTRKKIIAAIRKSIDFEIDITNQVFNPFGLARQYVKTASSHEKEASFFFPHQNETGYWWQGENSRLASMSSAVYMAMPYLRNDQKRKAKQYAVDQINWILGLNPYDVSMLDGIGYNNPIYDEGSGQVNIRGGVCNGITGGFENENDIAFMPLPQNDDMNHKWRWGEQWTLHGAWLIMALSFSTD